MTTIVISPHPDDAVLGLGQMIAATDDVEVVTVFAGLPAEGVLSAYDESCGFQSSQDAMWQRWVEDEAACGLLGASIQHLRFLDRQYEPDRPPSIAEEIVAALAPLWEQAEQVFAPLGIGHPDHVIAARCARSACPAGTMWVYEELPYRVLWPEQAYDELDRIENVEGFNIAALPAPIKVGDRARKEAAIAAYASQFPKGAEDPCLLVPERCWRIAH